jgi:hypothetical protein
MGVVLFFSRLCLAAEHMLVIHTYIRFLRRNIAPSDKARSDRQPVRFDHNRCYIHFSAGRHSHIRYTDFSRSSHDHDRSFQNAFCPDTVISWASRLHVSFYTYKIYFAGLYRYMDSSCFISPENHLCKSDNDFLRVHAQ